MRTRSRPRIRIGRLAAAMAWLVAMAAGGAEAQSASVGKRFDGTWASLHQYKIPEWYKDAKFGIFIHWGVYSVPAFGSEWYPREMYQPRSETFRHHVDTYGPQDSFGYKDFIPMFKAERYNPRDWAKLFKEAGAKYVVPVAEHHDGFAMYDSRLSEWTAVKKGPKRDLIGDLAKAVRSEGLVFGLSSHRAEHWFFFDGGRLFASDVQDPRYADFYGPAQPKFSEAEIPHEMDAKYGPDRPFMDDWLARTKELIDKYQPQLIYFDWWIGNQNFEPYRRELASYYYNSADRWKRGVVLNYKMKAFPEGTAVLDVERGQLAGIRSEVWQTDTAVAKNSWGYTTAQNYKSVDSIIDDLVDIISKNGTLLLNIGPRPDGTIVEHEQEMLRAIGGWLKVNGEAIYGTRPWRLYGEGPTQIVEGTFNDTKRGEFTGRDIRFTTKGEALYAIVLAWPGEHLTITSLAARQGQRVSKVELLGGTTPVRWSQTEQGLVVQTPGLARDGYAYAFRIHCAPQTPRRAASHR